jgi:hypothetical protein
MAAHDNVNKYQFHRQRDPYVNVSDYNVYKGSTQVGEMTVVHSVHDSPNWKVDWLGVDPEHRHIVPTLLGVGQVDAEAEGKSLMPSHNLSEHSSRVVQHLQKRGLVTQSAETEPSNDIGFRMGKYVHPNDRQGERLNTGHVEGGRHLIRKALKGR